MNAPSLEHAKSKGSLKASLMGFLFCSALLNLFYHSALLASSAHSQTQNQNSTALKIQNIIETYVSNHAFEGSVLVAESGKIIFNASYGLADRTNKLAINTQSSFQIASLSKPITAALILKLNEQGKLTLTNTLASYFPEFNNKISNKITLHQLLNHTSGLPNHFAIRGWFSTDFHQQTSENEFIKLIANQTLLFAPGSDYHYSNPAYFLLGKVIEKITNSPYEVALKQHIFAPLAMKGSGVASGFKVTPKAVYGYQWSQAGGYREQSPKNMSLFGAGAALYTTTEDFYRFDKALYNERLLSDQSKKLMFSEKHPYSWRLEKMNISSDVQVNTHTYDGLFDGYSAMATRFVDDKHSIILLSNIGTSFYIKQQLTRDLAAALYQAPYLTREHDASLKLINGIVSNNYSQIFTQLTSNKSSFTFSEQSLSSVAYELLWANIPQYAIPLFSFIVKQYPSSKTASGNLEQACQHRLSKQWQGKQHFCPKEQDKALK